MKLRPILLALTAAIILAQAGACQKQAPADQTSAAPPSEPAAAPRSTPPAQTPASKQQAAEAKRPAQAPVAAPQNFTPEPPVTTAEGAMQRLTQNSGLAIPAGSSVASFGDGGVPDPSIGFFEWVVISPTPLPLPNGWQIGDPEVQNLPVAQAVQIVEAKMGTATIDNPQTAFSAGWKTAGYAFSGTWVRGLNGDYLMVQQTRSP